jgi:hypothetical protein
VSLAPIPYHPGTTTNDKRKRVETSPRFARGRMHWVVFIAQSRARRSLTETPDEELSEYDRAVKAWCDNELKKMAKWYLDDLAGQK